ncbi:hypothetical protein HQ325_21725 [Rhodococcus sp. BP-349]|uniref:hypothetical protein n=1 Tax=unclassified Rhodococcus (in: high G+C Gram-positive bacteria) TaxID=192944 RepID=UPI001C9A6D41|nr:MULTISPECIES: hypothetical protein [unclassified Rhodococcus (in: high G+C Gram-positive bacteria)]MBY6541294.1 hypothetical protein [Rhodococcus sp. BP-363]MBY6544680.1 hypothetical protein [Rhodococcus sp. BP-369]MBY6563910.1 hypothetical protein [Rhodococcus sp. BP-370]MBY6579153.1 hypothetical protein [Rhodococcus sp. BP-364]MBY6588454.1 hypothetical protein [Rhodococcus sp. BP-358]
MRGEFGSVSGGVGRSRARRPSTCLWCGRPVVEGAAGRRRRYCRQSCRQRAYEQRTSLKDTAVADDAVVLTEAEAGAAADRAFGVRCAAEDVATAVAEGADAAELAELCDRLVTLAKDAERLR